MPTMQLTAISLLTAAATVVRISTLWLALTVPIPIYGVLTKVGLTETLVFVSGFVFGPAQGFITGLTRILKDGVTLESHKSQVQQKGEL